MELDSSTIEYDVIIISDTIHVRVEVHATNPILDIFATPWDMNT